VNVDLSALPIVVSAAMIPTVMIVVRSAYSIAVAPLSFRANALR
jgi:hypothetical protein